MVLFNHWYRHMRSGKHFFLLRKRFLSRCVRISRLDSLYSRRVVHLNINNRVIPGILNTQTNNHYTRKGRPKLLPLQDDQQVSRWPPFHRNSAKHHSRERMIRNTAGFFNHLTCRGCCDGMRLTRTMFKETWNNKSIRQSVESWYQLTPLRRSFFRFDERSCWLNDRTFTFLIVFMKSVLWGAGSPLALSQTSHTILSIEKSKMNSYSTSHGFQQRNLFCKAWPDQHTHSIQSTSQIIVENNNKEARARERERNHQRRKEALNLSLVVCQQR